MVADGCLLRAHGGGVVCRYPFTRFGVVVKPTIGRIVLYHFNNAALAGINGNSIACERPAIITSIRENGRINLHVLFEPDDLDAGTSWEEDRNHRFDVAHVPTTYLGEGEIQLPIAGMWSWPPRIVL